MAASSNATPRIMTRGEVNQFQVSFFADDAMTVPLVPISPQYPSFTIFDPSGTSIQAGVGTPTTPGTWVTQFMVPKDAPLSFFQQAPQRFGNEGQGEPLTNNAARYRIEWTMVTAENYQSQLTEEFDVRDVAVTQSLNRELKYLTLAGRPVRLLYRSTFLPYSTKLQMFTRGNDNSPVVDEFLNLADPNNPIGNIKFTQDGDSYVLYFDVDQGVTLPNGGAANCPNPIVQRNTAYMVLWDIQEGQFTVPDTQFQILTAISTNILPLMTSLRMLIDKFQKRLGRVQAYEDSDLLEYLANGLRIVNLSYPTTSFSMTQLPDDLQSFVLLAAGWYGLQAQSLLETDLSFNFSGQSVTLSVDRAAALNSSAAAMMETFNSSIAAAKMSYVRAAGGMGTVAGRAYNYRQMYQYVYKISTMGSDALLNTLTKIGLL